MQQPVGKWQIPSRQQSDSTGGSMRWGIGDSSPGLDSPGANQSAPSAERRRTKPASVRFFPIAGSVAFTQRQSSVGTAS